MARNKEGKTRTAENVIKSKRVRRQSLTSSFRSTLNSPPTKNSLPRLLPPAEAPVQPLRPRPAPRQRPHGSPFCGLDPHHLRPLPGLRARPPSQAGLRRDALLLRRRRGLFRVRGPGRRDGLSEVRGQPWNDRRDLAGVDGHGVELLHEARVGDRPRGRERDGRGRRGRR